MQLFISNQCEKRRIDPGCIRIVRRIVVSAPEWFGRLLGFYGPSEDRFGASKEIPPSFMGSLGISCSKSPGPLTCGGDLLTRYIKNVRRRRDIRARPRTGFAMAMASDNARRQMEAP